MSSVTPEAVSMVTYLRSHPIHILITPSPHPIHTLLTPYSHPQATLLATPSVTPEAVSMMAALRGVRTTLRSMGVSVSVRTLRT